ncbi:MAG: DUF1622 domain-containing protein [Candidatus Tumulicola sp.]
MEELLTTFSTVVAEFVEALAALIVLGAALEAVYGIGAGFFARADKTRRRRQIWTRFALWLVLALEFTLAADIVRTAIHPSWTSIGQLAGIAIIRTFLNASLARDLRESQSWGEAS